MSFAAIVCLELSAQFNAFMAMKARKEETKINKCAASCLHASGFPNDSSSYKAAYVVLLQTIVSPGAVAMVSRFIHRALAHLRALFFHVMSGCLFFFFFSLAIQWRDRVAQPHNLQRLRERIVEVSGGVSGMKESKKPEKAVPKRRCCTAPTFGDAERACVISVCCVK